jgi:hypothetical protein
MPTPLAMFSRFSPSTAASLVNEITPSGAHFQKAPMKGELTSLTLAVATLSTVALKDVLKEQDPWGYGYWSSIFEDKQWESLCDAINSSAGIAFDLSSCPSAARIDSLKSTASGGWYGDWLVGLHVLLYSTCRAGVRRPFAFELTNGLSRTGNLTTSVKQMVQWLYSANRIVEHLECLATDTTTRKETLKDGRFTVDELKSLASLYESIRPAANIWRSLPWGALTPFEELAAVALQCEQLPKAHYLSLDLALSSKAMRTKLNPAFGDRVVKQWWSSWSSPEFGNAAHLSVNSFNSMASLRRLRGHMANTLAAFDLRNPKSRAAITLLDDFSKGNAEILPEIDAVSKSLRESCEHLMSLESIAFAYRPSLGTAPRLLRRPTYPAPVLPSLVAIAEPNQVYKHQAVDLQI